MTYDSDATIEAGENGSKLSARANVGRSNKKNFQAIFRFVVLISVCLNIEMAVGESKLM
jgi:hypothetical protein